MLTCEKKVEDDSKSFGLTNYKNKLAIYGDGGRLGEEQVWGRNQECIKYFKEEYSSKRKMGDPCSRSGL